MKHILTLITALLLAPLATLRTTCLRVVHEMGMPSGAFASRDGRGEAEAAGSLL